MEIRPLREEEKEHFARMVATAFQQASSAVDNFVQNISVDVLRGIFDEQGRQLAGLRLIPERLWLGERPVAIAGISSVATPPEYRRQGHLKKLLQMVLAEEREQGRNLSALYPFEFPFYRKFGYELASATAEVKVEMSALTQLKSRSAGQWEVRQATDWESFRAIYDRYCQGRFGRFGRTTELWWRRGVLTVNGPAGERPQYLYTWKDSAGQVRAYVIYHLRPVGNSWDRHLHVRDMAWLDEAARYEIYCFLGNHDSQAQAVVWQTEPGDEVMALFSDPRQVEIKLDAGYMLRILDVERALTERAWPSEAKTGFTIAVQDDTLPWNHDRTFSLQAANGQAEVASVAGSNQAGLSCDVRVLAQLYAGYLSPRQAARLGKLTVNRQADLEAAQQLFSPPGQPASFMADFW